MKRNIFAIALIAILLMSCKTNGRQRVLPGSSITPSGVNDTTLLDVKKSYSGIEAEAAINVVFSDSVKCLLVIGDSAVVPYVEARVDDDELHLGYKKNVTISGNFDGITIFVPYNAKIKKIDISGASSFISQRPLVGSRFQVDVAGASQVVCYFDMPDGSLKAEVSGASQLKVNGAVQHLEADISGASQVISNEEHGQYTFTAGDAKVDISGASQMQFHCDGNLEGDVSGASLLTYTGKAKSNKVDCTGLSKVMIK
jgi:hypothetical protein